MEQLQAAALVYVRTVGKSSLSFHSIYGDGFLGLPPPPLAAAAAAGAAYSPREKKRIEVREELPRKLSFSLWCLY
jgi:hypothetical protein